MSLFSPSDISFHILTSCKLWFFIYIIFVSCVSLVTSFTLHLMFVGLFMCVLAYLKLPSPNPELVNEVLGELSYTKRREVGEVVAHRAACLDAPENSLEAVREAAKNGAKWIEFDISFTRDNVGVVFHDDTVDRVTDGSGPIADFTLEQLSRLDLSVKHPKADQFNDARIPTVDEFVGECLKNNIKMIIDLKTYTMPEETVGLLTSLYAKYPTLKQNSIVTSFFPNLLYKLRSTDANIVTAISTRPGFISCVTWEGTQASITHRFTGLKHMIAVASDAVFQPLLELVLWWVLGLSAVLFTRHVITRGFVDTWNRRGVTVMAWTVNCPKEKQFYSHVIKIPVLSDTIL